MKIKGAYNFRSLCKDIYGLGRRENEDVEVGIFNLGELDYFMELAQQVFEVQFETV